MLIDLVMTVVYVAIFVVGCVLIAKTVDYFVNKRKKK